MRLMITLPPQTWEQVRALAHAERRPPKHQIEFLVIEAARERAQVSEERGPDEVSHGGE